MSHKTGSKKHIHKYKKLESGIWACALPNCTHYMPLNVADQVSGKVSICWECNQAFILDERAMENEHPVCIECSGELNPILAALASRGL